MTASLEDMTPELDRQSAVVTHAREVLARAISECGAWRGEGSGWLRVLAAIGDLEDALRRYGAAPLSDLQAVDEAVRGCAWTTIQLVQIAEDVMGPDAAEYISGEGDPE